MRLKSWTAALALVLVSALNASAGSMLLLGAGTGTTVVATTTWDPSNKAASVTLTPSGGNPNLVATSSSVAFDSVKTIASHSTGKFFFSAVVSGTNNLMFMSFCNASFSVTASNPGSTTNCVNIPFTSGTVGINGGVCGGVVINVGDVLDTAIDLGGKLLWYRTNNGAWQGNGGATPNPVTGTNGCNISAIAAGPYFPTTTWDTGSSASMTANFGATAFTNPPAGFGNW